MFDAGRICFVGLHVLTYFSLKTCHIYRFFIVSSIGLWYAEAISVGADGSVASWYVKREEDDVVLGGRFPGLSCDVKNPLMWSKNSQIVRHKELSLKIGPPKKIAKFPRGIRCDQYISPWKQWKPHEFGVFCHKWGPILHVETGDCAPGGDGGAVLSLTAHPAYPGVVAVGCEDRDVMGLCAINLRGKWSWINYGIIH